MPQAEFAPALKAVLAHEGGYVNHPKDPGGETNRGVTQRVYDGWRKRNGKEPRSVRFIEADELQAIYKRQYWDVIRGDELPAGLAYAVFDGAVNSGPAQAVRWLQRALRMNQVDGVLGEATLAAALAHPDHDQLVADMLALRQRFLENLRTFSTFGRGWTSRVRETRQRAQAWAAGSVGPEPSPAAGGQAKARREDAKAAPSTAVPDAALGAGVGSAGTAGVIKEAQAQLEPLAGTSSTVATIVAVLAIASAALVIGGFAVRAFQAWRARRREEALS